MVSNSYSRNSIRSYNTLFVNQKLFKFLGFTAIAIVMFFFGSRLVDSWDAISGFEYSLSVSILIATVLFSLHVIVTGVIWGMLLNNLTDCKTSLFETGLVEGESWILKYIPGQIGPYLFKIAWARKRGISKKIVTLSYIYEYALITVVSVVIPLFILSFSFGDLLFNNGPIIIAIMMLGPLVLVFNQQIFSKFLNVIFTRLNSQSIPKGSFLSAKSLAGYGLLFIVPRIMFGAAFVLISASIFPVETKYYVSLGAIYVLAGIVGMLAIFVPSGLVVREAIVVLLASRYFTVDQAIVISLVARFYATISDALVYVIVKVFSRYRKSYSID